MASMAERRDLEERRQFPRAAASCPAKIILSGGRHFTASAEDVGTAGCRVIAPAPVARGTALRVILTSGHGEVDLLGSVAWVTEQAPWRLGIAFAPPSIAAARAWFERLGEAGGADAAPAAAGAT
jgi:hypothetical protein